jgi:N-ethylmaleimide reductase
MASLFTPFHLNGLALRNRIVMAPMTRTRASEDGVPTDLMRDYYVQRASAGLIITECIQVSDQGRGVIRAPGMHRADQIAGWRKITDAVHAAGGRIYGQLWHAGRVSHPDIRGGVLPVAPSAIPAEGDFYLPTGRVDFPTPRELRIEEIAPIVADFAQATVNAREAGFDGVELHGANGYLQDQFLQDNTNKRTDAYGGSVAGRARLMIETAQAMAAAWSADRVGVRLSPSSFLYGVRDSDTRTTFSHVIKELNSLRLSYLHLREPSANDLATGNIQIEHVADAFRGLITVPLILNGGFDKASATAALSAGSANLIAFGVPYISNPDLVERLQADAPLSAADMSTAYGLGAKGYTDYPALAREAVL